jgi:hypothetical protein
MTSKRPAFESFGNPAILEDQGWTLIFSHHQKGVGGFEGYFPRKRKSTEDFPQEITYNWAESSSSSSRSF